MTSLQLRPTGRVAVLFSLMLLVACRAEQQHAPPAPEVAVMTVKERAAAIDLTYMARIAGVREVEVRARVSGILLRKHYKEGARVKEGNLLFTIDPSQYAAEAARAKAQLGVEQARLQEAQRERDRVVPLAEQGVVSRRERDQALANYESAEAAVAAANAAAKRAALDLSYTEVRAPISGLTSREARSEGSLISANDETSLLTRIVQTDSLYVEFAMPATEANLVRNALAQSPLHVRVLAADDRESHETAQLTFLDTAVDQASGTVQARATLKANVSLLPGQFVRARVDGVTLPKATMIPARAVLRSPMGTMVWVVGKENKVQPRPVQLGETTGNEVAALTGLTPGERIIVNGIIKVQPDAVVNPVAIDEPKPAAAPTAAPASSAPSSSSPQS